MVVAHSVGKGARLNGISRSVMSHSLAESVARAQLLRSRVSTGIDLYKQKIRRTTQVIVGSIGKWHINDKCILECWCWAFHVGEAQLYAPILIPRGGKLECSRQPTALITGKCSTHNLGCCRSGRPSQGKGNVSTAMRKGSLNLVTYNRSGEAAVELLYLEV